ncbi:MAG: winged helix-turn-helix domain-containing protein [Pyrinomonadaceae bacterium]|nr:winged helix-turn-helix domain-containing protein [Pyrinomonadaceae bacterium]
MTNEEEVMQVRQRIEEFLAKDRQLKAELKENNRNIQIAEEYLAHLLGKQVSEISSVKSITDHLEDILRANMRPMKAQELWEMIRAITGLENTALPTVTTALIRNSNKGKRFEKVAPNTYELLIKKEEENM